MKSSLGSRSGAGKNGTGRSLSPAFLERQWKPGQSGNPSGQSAEYGEVVGLARCFSVRAVERLGELIEADDERVALVACNSVLDRAFGKPATNQPETEDSFEQRYRQMTPEQREADAHALVALIRQRLRQPDAQKMLADTSTEVKAGEDRPERSRGD